MTAAKLSRLVLRRIKSPAVRRGFSRRAALLTALPPAPWRRIAAGVGRLFGPEGRWGGLAVGLGFFLALAVFGAGLGLGMSRGPGWAAPCFALSLTVFGLDFHWLLRRSRGSGHSE